MSRLVVLTAAEQVAAHLRDEMLRGMWSGLMPGGDRLAAELGIGRDTVEAALRRLEEEGLLLNQGRRRGRLIVPQTAATETVRRAGQASFCDIQTPPQLADRQRGPRQAAGDG